MKKKQFLLALVLMLSLVGLCGCGNEGTSVLELEFPTDSNKGEDAHFELIRTNWQATKYEALSDITDVNMAIKKDSSSPVGAILVFENDSNKQIVFGQEYILETRVDNIWYEIPIRPDKPNLSKAGYEVSFGQSKEFEVEWQELYGELKPGVYRIIKDLIDFRTSSNWEKGYMACEFEIK